LAIPIAYTPFPYNVGDSILVHIDDKWSNAILLPFDFCFFGINYNKVLIGSNGVLTFDIANAGGTCPWGLIGQNPLPNPNLPRNSIMGVYEDTDPTFKGTIYWQLTGNYPSRKLVVSYYQIPYYGDPNSVNTSSCGGPLYLTSQMVLYETTNAIDIYIKDKPVCTGWNQGKAIEGIQNASGTVAYTIAGRNNTVWTATNDAYRFLPMGTNIVTFSWLQNGSVISNNTILSVCPTQNTTYVSQVVYNGCNGAIVTLQDTMQVSITNSVQSSINLTQPTGCTATQNGSASVSIVSGTGPFTYQWSNGATTSSISNVGAGTYICTITDGNGCISRDTAVLVYPSFLSVPPPVITNVHCAGGSDGNILVAPTGGTNPYNYVWSAGGSLTPNSGLLGAGNYAVTVTDAAGCSVIVNNINITEPSAIQVVPTVQNNNCYGGATGSVLLNASGGTGTLYNYNWSPSVSTDSLASGLSAGVYTTTVTDINGCSLVVSNNVTQPSAIVFNVALVNSSCEEPNGSATTNISGATPGYSYLWNTGAATSSIQNLAIGNYSLTVTDNNGCVRDTQFVISTTPKPILSLSAVDSICKGNAVTISSAVTSGTGPFTYNWNPSLSSIANLSDSPLATQTYTAYINDANNCKDTAFKTVTVIELPILTTVIDSVNCNSGADGSILLNVLGGIAPLNFAWTPNVSSNNLASNLTAGNYSVIVTDHLGCSQSISATVEEPLALAFNMSISMSTCSLPNGTALTAVTGGVTPYNYQWSGGVGASSAATNLTPAVYHLTVVDQYTCVADTQFVISSTPNPIATISGSDSICIGENTSLSVSVANQVLPLSYQWTPSLPSTASVIVAPSTTQSYEVIVTDGNNCTDTTSFQVNVEALPVITFAQPDTAKCGTLELSFSANVVPANSSLIWDFGDNQTSDLFTPSHLYSEAGVYDVSIQATSSLGCTSTLVIDSLVTVHPIPLIHFDITPGILFDDNSLVMLNNLSVGAINYLWNFGDGVGTSTEVNPIYNYPDSGQYLISLIGESEFGCIDSTSEILMHVINTYAFIPNCFTPNNDGKNDLLHFYTVNAFDFSFVLFDRWGKVIFSTTNVDDVWDGKVDGVDLPEGTYMYKLNYTSLKHLRKESLGRITIIR
jgi:gliding motility-associated-like protein